jgi:chorismate mutase
MCERDVCQLDQALLDLLNRRLLAEKGVTLEKMIEQLKELAADLNAHAEKLRETGEQLKVNNLPDNLLKEIEAQTCFALSDLRVIISTLEILRKTRDGTG